MLGFFSQHLALGTYNTTTIDLKIFIWQAIDGLISNAHYFFQLDFLRIFYRIFTKFCEYVN